MRRPNLLLDHVTRRILGVDFDWSSGPNDCDDDAVAYYPENINMESDIPWHPDVRPCGPIKPEHDQYLLDQDPWLDHEIIVVFRPLPLFDH
jgi:hypothetical protein